ncbi:hypothetical protein [Corynebacterium sp. HS2168-gen11]|uniref:hypothetical protein n=1 Tax=Corynebacterium sp. HS2168-gen11 TaxID=2974027 RepID=UPI00216ADE83|nr:hypothetical protein [Corynebacterium sp. HS2168-gen11]MCS4535190.1 hypothetical protein [Corynebacterium sp. HS2168-gen11]
MSHNSVSRICIAMLTTALFLNSIAVPTSFAQESAAAPAANETTTTATPTTQTPVQPAPTPSAPTSSTTPPTEQPTSAQTATAQPATPEKQEQEQKDPSKKDPEKPKTEKPTKTAGSSSQTVRVILTLINFVTGGSLRPLLALIDDRFRLHHNDADVEDVSKLTKVQLATRWISVFVAVFSTLASVIAFSGLAEKTLRQI